MSSATGASSQDSPAGDPPPGWPGSAPSISGRSASSPTVWRRDRGEEEQQNAQYGFSVYNGAIITSAHHVAVELALVQRPADAPRRLVHRRRQRDVGRRHPLRDERRLLLGLSWDVGTCHY